MDPKQKKKNQNKHKNVLESLKEIGGDATSTLKKDVVRPKDFMDQIFGYNYPRKVSGEFGPQESLNVEELISGEHQKNQELQKQLAFERRLRQEEEIRIEKKSNELKLELHAIMQEIIQLSESTQDLAEETKIAALQAPVAPGVYHILFFEKLLEFIKSFRKKIESARIWLNTTNKRAQKKDYWSRYKKHGGKFLLSGEHYLTRSAG